MHGAGGHFLQSIMHMVFTSMVWSAMFRIVRHIPLPILIVLILAVIVFGFVYARRNGRRLF